MRIALFTDTFHEVNGVSMVYRRFARWCEGRDIELEIFTPGGRATDFRGNVTVHSIPMLLPVPYYHNLSFDALPLRPRLERYFRENSFDLVHIATQGHMAIVGLRAAGEARAPNISCYHTKLPEYAASRFISFFGDNSLGRKAAALAEWASWTYQKRLYRSSRLVLVPTESARALIMEKAGKQTAIFSRGVDCEAFSPAHRVRQPGDDSPRSIYVGRVSVEKNLALLFKLFDGGGDLVVVGDGPFRKIMRKRLPSARFAGFLHGEDLAQAYASADILVFPSKTETFGNAVLEAMASGLAVLVTDEGGPKDFVRHGETGLVARSDEEFIELHGQLVADAALRKKLGAGAREFALTQSWDEIFEKQVLGTYRKVISEAAE